MYQFSFKHNPPEEILCLGAHCDDIEIGCGGTLLSLLASHAELRVRWLIFSGGESRSEEAIRSADLFGDGRIEILIHDFQDGYFPYIGSGIKNCFESLKTSCAPDIIFTHHLGDFHQDHRLVAELSRNTFRDHLILEYEIPKYDGDLSRPSWYFPLSQNVLDTKISYLERSYPSQRGRSWFDKRTFEGIARLRGIESNSKSGFAEAFHCRKMVIF